MNRIFTLYCLRLFTFLLFSLCNSTAMAAIPKAPATLTATAAGTDQINLAWVDASRDETGFELEQSTDGIRFIRVVALPVNTVQYQQKALIPATRYWFRIRARNASGVSAYSNVASATTRQLPPEAPTDLSAVPTAPGLIQLRWARPAADAAEVLIERAKAGSAYVQLARLPATVLQYEDRSEFENADYSYRIKARNAGGDSPYSLLAIVRAASIITAAEVPAGQHRIYAAGRKLVVDLARNTEATVAVYQTSGACRKSQKIRQAAEIDLGTLPAGIYIVVTDTGKEVTSRRILLY